MNSGLTRLFIHRFRGIREGQVEDLRKLNLLIGPNNSGKTAILEMLYLSGVSGRKAEIVGEGFEFKGSQEEKGPESASEGKNQTEQDTPTQNTANAQSGRQPNSKVDTSHETAASPTVSLKRDFLYYAPLPRLRQRHEYGANDFAGYRVFLDDSGNLLFELQRLPDDSPLKYFHILPERPAYGITDFEEEDKYLVGFFSLYQPKHFSPLKPPETLTKTKLNGHTRWTFIWDSLWVHRHGPFEEEQDEQGNATLSEANFFGIWVEEGSLPDPHFVLFIDFHAATEPFMPTFAQETWEKVPEWEEKIAESMSKVFPELKGCRISIRPGPQGRVWTGYIQEKGKYPVEIAQYGDGARHAFKVLAALIALVEQVEEEHPGLFLWEDPELFMHPATLGRLLEEVTRLISGKPVQMFITTQSLEVIAWMANLSREEKERRDILRFHSLNLQNGKLEVYPFHVETVLNWLEGGLDLREINTGLIENFPLTWKLRSSETGEAPW